MGSRVRIPTGSPCIPRKPNAFPSMLRSIDGARFTVSGSRPVPIAPGSSPGDSRRNTIAGGAGAPVIEMARERQRCAAWDAPYTDEPRDFPGPRPMTDRDYLWTLTYFVNTMYPLCRSCGPPRGDRSQAPEPPSASSSIIIMMMLLLKFKTPVQAAGAFVCRRPNFTLSINRPLTMNSVREGRLAVPSRDSLPHSISTLDNPFDARPLIKGERCDAECDAGTDQQQKIYCRMDDRSRRADRITCLEGLIVGRSAGNIRRKTSA